RVEPALAGAAAQVVDHRGPAGAELDRAHREERAGAVAVDHVGRELGDRLAQGARRPRAELPLARDVIAPMAALAGEPELDVGPLGGQRGRLYARPGGWLPAQYENSHPTRLLPSWRERESGEAAIRGFSVLGLRPG